MGTDQGGAQRVGRRNGCAAVGRRADGRRCVGDARGDLGGGSRLLLDVLVVVQLQSGEVDQEGATRVFSWRAIMTLSTDCLGAHSPACWGAVFGFESAAVYPRRPGRVAACIGGWCLQEVAGDVAGGAAGGSGAGRGTRAQGGAAAIALHASARVVIREAQHKLCICCVRVPTRSTPLPHHHQTHPPTRTSNRSAMPWHQMVKSWAPTNARVDIGVLERELYSATGTGNLRRNRASLER